MSPILSILNHIIDSESPLSLHERFTKRPYQQYTYIMVSIHLVCYANVFRSRLAEAYLKKHLEDQGITNIKIASSGVKASLNTHGPISWYGARILINESLTQYMTHTWVQTTKELLDKADAVVFVDNSVFQEAKKMGYNGKNYKIWYIEDISRSGLGKTSKNQDDLDLKIIHTSEKIYEIIKEHVNKVIKEMLPSLK